MNDNAIDQLTERARTVFANDRYATELTGATIDYVGDGEARCSLATSELHRNAKGAVMGGVLFTLADLAFAVAANSAELTQASDVEHVALCWVSASSTIHFLNAANGTRLNATARPVKRGRTTAVYQITVDDGQRDIALVTTTGHKLQ